MKVFDVFRVDETFGIGFNNNEMPEKNKNQQKTLFSCSIDHESIESKKKLYGTT